MRMHTKYSTAPYQSRFIAELAWSGSGLAQVDLPRTQEGINFPFLLNIGSY